MYSALKRFPPISVLDRLPQRLIEMSYLDLSTKL